MKKKKKETSIDNNELVNESEQNEIDFLIRKFCAALLRWAFYYWLTLLPFTMMIEHEVCSVNKKSKWKAKELCWNEGIERDERQE